MIRFHLFCLVTPFVLFHCCSGAILNRLFNGATVCGNVCEKELAESESVLKACSEGCRLYTVINLAKNLHNSNKSVELCKIACSEAFINASTEAACSRGCNSYPPANESGEDQEQTLHVLHPLVYVRSVFQHVRRLVSASWTVYVQEDDGKVILMQSGPRVVQTVEYKGDEEQAPEPSRVDWMDCLSAQSGVPRWIIVFVPVFFVLSLMWLCCATTQTAPPQYVHSHKEKDMEYVLIYDSANDMKAPLLEENAPPLPPKYPQ